MTTADSLTLATFNVKDLIDPVLALPQAGAVAAKDAKLDAIAREIVRADPDVLGLQEVGSETLLAAVVGRVARQTGATYARVMGTVDARGIGCALVSRLPVVRSEVHVTPALPFPVFDPDDPPPFGARLPLRRGIVHARVETRFGEVDVLVAHLKSQHGVPARGGDGAAEQLMTGSQQAAGLLRSLVWRGAEALFVRGIVDGLFARDATARIVVMGDLNDRVRSTPLRVIEGGGPTALAGVEALVSVERRFTILHARPGDEPAGQQLDHILLSRALATHAVSAVMQNESLRWHRSPQGAEPPSADSDHALYAVTLR